MTPQSEHTTVIRSAMTKVIVKQLGNENKMLIIKQKMLKNCALPDK